MVRALAGLRLSWTSRTAGHSGRARGGQAGHALARLRVIFVGFSMDAIQQATGLSAAPFPTAACPGRTRVLGALDAAGGTPCPGRTVCRLPGIVPLAWLREAR